MFTPNYSYGLGNSFNPNADSQQIQLPAQLPHHQNGQQHQQQNHQQHQPNIMYSPQQYLDQVGPQLSPYGSIGNAGTMGIGSNNGMAHLGSGNAISSYQTPYSSSPYNSGIATSTSNLMSNIMPNSNTLSAYAMNLSSSSPQHQTPRLQVSSNSSTPNQISARVSSFTATQQNTSPNSTTPLSQFPSIQNLNQQLPSPISNQQSQSAQILTPQTPKFPAGFQGVMGTSSTNTPLSPESEFREKERVTMLLNINKELLLEVMRLQAAQNDSKEDSYSASNDVGEKEKSKSPTLSRYYFECMRRLQANLAYLAARADRNKSYSHSPAHPQIMSAPSPSSKTFQNNPAACNFITYDNRRDQEEKDVDVEGDRSQIIREYYRRLQALFPGVDPRKDSFSTLPGRVQQSNPQQQAHKLGTVDSNVQQRMQADLYRQKLLHNQQNSYQGQLR